MTTDTRTATARADVPRFRHTPFDTAVGTVATGVALTAVLVWLLRLMH